MNALIIEDSPVFIRTLEHTLQQLGFDTVQADSATGGEEALRQHRFDLLILDLHLPDLSGLEFCRRLRAQSAHRLLPVLMLTSDDSELLLQRALDAGVTELFRKARLNELHTSLRDYIARMQRRYQGRVLLVEDSPTTSALLSYMLGKMSLEVTPCDRAEIALTLIPTGSFDLIISDVVLAGQVTGLGLVRGVRSLEGEVARTPILGLSALEDAARKIEMLKMGANDYVSKPVIEEEFIARVGNLITAKQLLDQVQAQRLELRERSIRDQLTGLYNRHYLAEASIQLFAQAERQQREIGMLVFDLDHFKRINDAHGHDGGDRVLTAVGQLLARGCRQGDVPARFGGEEFVVLLPDCSEVAALQLAARLLEQLRALNPAGIGITASIGVAVLPAAEAEGFDRLFKLADQAVYRAKELGRNRVELGR